MIHDNNNISLSDFTKSAMKKLDSLKDDLSVGAYLQVASGINSVFTEASKQDGVEGLDREKELPYAIKLLNGLIEQAKNNFPLQKKEESVWSQFRYKGSSVNTARGGNLYVNGESVIVRKNKDGGFTVWRGNEYKIEQEYTCNNEKALKNLLMNPDEKFGETKKYGSGLDHIDQFNGLDEYPDS